MFDRFPARTATTVARQQWNDCHLRVRLQLAVRRFADRGRHLCMIGRADEKNQACRLDDTCRIRWSQERCTEDLSSSALRCLPSEVAAPDSKAGRGRSILWALRLRTQPNSIHQQETER